MSNHDVELRPATNALAHSHDEDASHPGFTLPRADGGREAWLVLASCFVLEATVWGKDKLLSPFALPAPLTLWSMARV